MNEKFDVQAYMSHGVESNSKRCIMERLKTENQKEIDA